MNPIPSMGHRYQASPSCIGTLRVQSTPVELMRAKGEP